MTPVRNRLTRGALSGLVTALLIGLALLVVIQTRERGPAPAVVVHRGRAAVATPEQPSGQPAASTPFLPISAPHGARGMVSVQTSGSTHLKLKLTITISVPRERFGVVLWSSPRKWVGLYTGYPGTNTQTLTISPRRLLRYRWLDVAQGVVRGPSRGHASRRDVVAYRHLLRAPTSKVLTALLLSATNNGQPLASRGAHESVRPHPAPSQR